ncbi:J domain-containing protein, partial [archaeon]
MYCKIGIGVIFFIVQVTLLDSFGLGRVVMQRNRLSTEILTNYHCFNQAKTKASLYASSAESDVEWDPYSAPKLDFDECYYAVLEVDPRGDVQKIKKAYHKLVLKYHPDNKESDTEKALGNKQMMVINNAYKILKDTSTRQEYDTKRSKGLVGGRAGVKGTGQNHPRYAKQKPSSSPPPPPNPTTTRPSASVKSPNSVRTPQSDRVWDWE